MFSHRRRSPGPMVLTAGLAILALAAAAPFGAVRADDGSAGEAIPQMLATFCTGYADAVPESSALVVQFRLTEPDTAYYIEVRPVRVVESHPGTHASPSLTLTMSAATLHRIHDGTLTAFTAAAKAAADRPALLEFTVHAAIEQVGDPTSAMLGFLQHFFTPSRPERIVLDEAHARVIHGAHAIPLYYAVGFRSAWYKIKPGQQLNEPGDTNPFPQAFVIIGGQGRAKIGDVEVEVRPGESYYIPPGSDHILWPAGEAGLKVIWLAWGPGA
ncbi:MAG: cupin domain-containing protein [Candidatus Eisenbacteria sp.]|nr:cupin domain-containing protein [Candidatus Eisenbacteria bacterium]